MKFTVRFSDGTETTVIAPTIFGAMTIAEQRHCKKAVGAVPA